MFVKELFDFFDIHFIFFCLVVFVFSATIASFICLAVERLPHQLKWCDNPIPGLSIVHPRSFCNNCKQTISLLYVLPVLGFFFSRGRCSQCKKKIPIKYPLIEILCGIGSVLIFCYLGVGGKSFFVLFLLWILLFLTLIDLAEHWLPAVVTYPLIWLGLMFSPFEPEPIMRIYGGAVCFFIMWLSMKLTSILKKTDVFAGGDIALSCAAGAWLGLHLSITMLLISSVVFILYSIPFRLKNIHWVPMGPALSIGFMICLF